MNVARHLVGRGLKAAFDRYLPEVAADANADDVFGPYKPIVDHFGKGNRIQLGDTEDDSELEPRLKAIDGLQKLAAKHVPVEDEQLESVAAMEFVLEGLHQAKMVGKDDVDGSANYYDMMGDILEGIDTDR